MKKEKNEKKLSKEKISKNVDFTSKKIDAIMHSRLIIAIFMIVDGLSFALNPNQSMNSMAQTVAISAFLASGAILIAYIKSDNKDIKTLTLPIIMIIVSIVIFIFPRPFAVNLRMLLAAFIILNGLINIFNIKKLDDASENLTNRENKLKSKFDKETENANTQNKGVILEQTSRLLDPLNNFIERANKKYYLYLILNILSIVLGIFLLTANNITIIVCGIIIIYTGLFDLLMFIRSSRLSKKNKKINKN